MYTHISYIYGCEHGLYARISEHFTMFLIIGKQTKTLDINNQCNKRIICNIYQYISLYETSLPATRIVRYLLTSRLGISFLHLQNLFLLLFDGQKHPYRDFLNTYLKTNKQTNTKNNQVFFTRIINFYRVIVS